MCMEIVAMAGVVVSAIGIGLGWYTHHQVDKKKEKEKQEAEYSIERNLAGLP